MRFYNILYTVFLQNKMKLCKLFDFSFTSNNLNLITNLAKFQPNRQLKKINLINILLTIQEYRVGKSAATNEM